MGIKVRRADPSDLDWILGELKEFAKSYGTQKSLFGDDMDYSRKHVSALISQHVCFVAENVRSLYPPGTNPVGFIAGFLQPHPYNPAIRLLAEAFWWVIPKMRRGRASLLLLEAFIEHGKKNADWVAMFLENQSPIKDRSLNKRGFKTLERTFLMEVGV